jgi:hypothetical protein
MSGDAFHKPFEPFAPDYWLHRCVGFSVYTLPERYVGFVEEIRRRSRIDGPDVLVVRTDSLGQNRMVVPVEEVAEILPGRERVIVRAALRGVLSPVGHGSDAPEPHRSRSRRASARSPLTPAGPEAA